MRAKGPIGYTCPSINNAIDEIKSVISNLIQYENMSKEDLIEFLSNEDNFQGFKDEISDNLKTLKELAEGDNCILENLRSDNSELRDWGSELSEEKNSLENDNYRLNYQIDDMKNEISSLNNTVEDLENQIIDLQYEISEIQSQVNAS